LPAPRDARHERRPRRRLGRRAADVAGRRRARALHARARPPAGIARRGEGDRRGGRRRADRAARARLPAPVTRVAAVDLGTNTTRLLLANVADGNVDAKLRVALITRLGDGVDAGRRLRPDAIERVHSALEGFDRAIDEFGAERVLAAATSAVRDAADGRDFLH